MRVTIASLALLATVMAGIMLEFSSACCHGMDCNIFACNCGDCMPRYGSPMTYPGCGYFSSSGSSCYTNYNGVYYTAGRKKREMKSENATASEAEPAGTGGVAEAGPAPPPGAKVETADSVPEARKVAAKKAKDEEEAKEKSKFACRTTPESRKVAAKKAKDEEEAKEKSKFAELDKNGDLVLTRDEVAQFAVEAGGASRAQLARSSDWFKELDEDGDGKLQMGEFDAASD